MNLGDIYKHKENNSLIQIDSFATHLGKSDNNSLIIVFRQIEKHNEYEIGSCPSFNGYGSLEEIENLYEILVTQNDLKKYSNWHEIFALIDKGD